MSKITGAELKKIDEPCRFCDISAHGSGSNKVIVCNKKGAELEGNWEIGWFRIMGCPKISEQG